MAQPEGLLYSKEHEWVKIEGDTATIGITDYAQNSLGDIVYVELPKAGSKIEQFGNVGVIESVKAVSDLFTPISGEILEVNAVLDSDPAAVNKDPYGQGWLMKVRVSNAGETAALLSAADYEKIATDEVYTPHTERDIAQMLEAIGAGSLEELLRVPEAVALKAELDVVPALPEYQIARRFDRFAKKNGATAMRSFLGAGAYRHYVPPAIAALAMRGEFLTAYTPYQAEVSQGYLQAIYEWQSYICLLTGMDIANASVYDGATALAEGAIMALNATGRRKILISRAVHPNYRAVLTTYCNGLDVEIDEAEYAPDGITDEAALKAAVASGKYAAVVLQSPNFFGNVDTLPRAVLDAVLDSETVPIAVVAEALSLAVLATPASWGAQIVVGEAQSFGVPVAYGGPYAGFIASTQEHMRRIPGRLVGKTVDNSGRSAYVLTLQAREQHIRRERATSNICTNQAHCALIATIYLALLGKTGLRDAGALNLQRSRELATAVSSVEGITLKFVAPFFNEFVADVHAPAAEVLAKLQERGILGGVDLGRFYPELSTCILMTATELTTAADVAALSAALSEVVHVHASV